MSILVHYTVLILGFELTLNPMILRVSRYKIAALKVSQIIELHCITLQSYVTELLNPKKRFV